MMTKFVFVSAVHVVTALEYKGPVPTTPSYKKTFDKMKIINNIEERFDFVSSFLSEAVEWSAIFRRCCSAPASISQPTALDHGV